MYGEETLGDNKEAIHIYDVLTDNYKFPIVNWDDEEL